MQQSHPVEPWYVARMSSTEPEPPAWIKKLTENFRSIRLPGGVVGKSTRAMLAVIGVWAVIAWQLSDNLTRDAMLLIAGAIVTGAFIWWVKSSQGFAARNPAQAMLDGAEFLEWQRFEAQAKGILKVTDSPLISDPAKPTPAIEHNPTGPDSDG